MRIAFLTSTPLDFVRGSGTYAGISALARGLERMGVEVALFAPRRHFPVYTLERLWFNETLGRGRFHSFDAVVGFDMDGFRIAGRTGVPHVAAIKGVIADEMRYERGATRWTMALQAACERKHARRAATVLTTSAYAAGRIRELYGVEARVVPELIDLDWWRELHARYPAAPEPGKFVVLTVCRLYPRKRIVVLLEAAAKLRRPGLEVRVVGRGPEEARLRALAERLDLGGTVHWLGDVSQPELARQYQACNVFCLPSVQEGFGIVFLEAMAAGRPVVAARAAAAPEVVTEGVLVEPENPNALAEALAALREDPERRREIGKAGQRLVEHYDLPRVAGLLLAEIRKISGGSGESRRSPCSY